MSEKFILTEEPYVGIQGEGRFVGMNMLFVRLAGCNVGCSYCDSVYTWGKSGMVYDFIKLNESIQQSGVSNVWITGGEPTMQNEALRDYLKYHKLSGITYHICTAGRNFDNEVMQLLDQITVDVKAPSSNTYSDEEFLSKISILYAGKSEFKMVIGTGDEDMEFAEKMIAQYPYMKWTLQPKYISEIELKFNTSLFVNTKGWDLSKFATWVTETFKTKSHVRLGLQLHKELYPHLQRGI